MTSAPKVGNLLFARLSVDPPGTPGTYVPLLTVGDITWNSYEATAVERPVVGVMGPELPALHAEPRTTATFSLGLAGSGTQGTPPVMGAVLRACALSEEIDEDTSVTYAPVNLLETDTTEACDFLRNESGQEQESAKSRGTVVFTFPSAGIPVAEFSMMGSYDRPYTEAMPTPEDFGGQSLYKIVNANTTLKIIAGAEEYSLCFENFNVTLGAAYEVFALGGCEQDVKHTDISATWTATAIRSDDYDLDLWALLEERSGEGFTIELRHGVFTGPGANPGYRVSLDLTEAFIDSIATAQIKGKAARTLSGFVKRNQIAVTFD
jgi:hypothetical protein